MTGQAQLDDIITKNAREIAERMAEQVTTDGIKDGAVDTWTREIDAALRAMMTGLTMEGICREAFQTTKEKGWLDGYTGPGGENPRNNAEVIALMHSELSEALEGCRKPGPSDKIPEFTQEEEEFADTLIRILDHVAKHQLRLVDAMRAKIIFNRSREHRHGGKLY